MVGVDAEDVGIGAGPADAGFGVVDLGGPLGLSCEAILGGYADVTLLGEGVYAGFDAVFVASYESSTVKEDEGCCFAELVGGPVDVAVQVAFAAGAEPDDASCRRVPDAGLALVLFEPGDVFGYCAFDVVLGLVADVFAGLGDVLVGIGYGVGRGAFLEGKVGVGDDLLDG